jgi:hypothetical protein
MHASGKGWGVGEMPVPNFGVTHGGLIAADPCRTHPSLIRRSINRQRH